MIGESKKTIQILKASILKWDKVLFFHCKISNKTITQQFACAAGENFWNCNYFNWKNTYFSEVWGNYMLRVCLGILKNFEKFAPICL